MIFIDHLVAFAFAKCALVETKWDLTFISIEADDGMEVDPLVEKWASRSGELSESSSQGWSILFTDPQWQLIADY